MIVPPDPLAAAWAALFRVAAGAGRALTPIDDDSRPWWSATFSGDAVWMTIAVEEDESVDAWLATLPDAEWSIADRFVADCHVGRCGGTALISLLVLDEDDR